MASEGVPLLGKRPDEATIFISFSHVDNQTLYEPRGWVDDFCTALEYALKQASPTKFKLWRDIDQLQSDMPFWARMGATVRSATVFLAIISPRYLSSPFCRRELQEAEAQNIRRIKVVKSPVDHAQLPPMLRGIQGHQFYVADSTGTSVEFKKGDRDFYDHIDRLAADIMRARVFGQASGRSSDS